MPRIPWLLRIRMEYADILGAWLGARVPTNSSQLYLNWGNVGARGPCKFI